MKNLFSTATDRAIDEIFDLKGSKLDRQTPPENRKPGNSILFKMKLNFSIRYTPKRS